MGWFFGSSSSSPPKPPHSPYAVQEQAPPAPASPEFLAPGPAKQGIRAVMLGPAEAGKYDQADRLAKKYASCHLTIGELLQSEVRADTPLGQKVRQMAKDEGQLSDELIFELIDKNLVMAECRNGYIFDDFPHNKEQAQKLDKLLEDRRAPLQAAVQLAIKDKDQKQPPENAEVINYYAKRGLLAPIDVSGSVEQVEQKLDKLFTKMAQPKKRFLFF